MSMNQNQSPQESIHITILIAGNPNTPAHILDELASHIDKRIAERVAENPRTSTETLSTLIEHEDADVRSAVANNINAPSHLILALVNDESPDGRYSLAENASLPLEYLEVLAEDENPYISCRARQTMMRIEGGNVTQADFQSANNKSAKLRAV